MAGVVVCGCAPRDCTSREGPKWLRERFFDEREAELQERVDRRRVRVATFAPGDLRGSVAAFEAFRSELAALQAPSPDTATEIDLVCDPVPLEEDA